MKRWLRIFAVGLTAGVLFSCVGCGKKSPDNAAKPVVQGFSCEATIHFKEMEVASQLTRKQDGKLTVAFQKPKSLSGVTLGWDGKKMTMEMGGMSMTLPEDKVPEGALARSLLQVLAAEHGKGTHTEEGYVISGEAEGKAYVLVCDPNTGLPRSMSLPEEDLSAAFTNVTLLDSAAAKKE